MCGLPSRAGDTTGGGGVLQSRLPQHDTPTIPLQELIECLHPVRSLPPLYPEDDLTLEHDDLSTVVDLNST